jgi:hypothetical protein
LIGAALLLAAALLAGCGEQADTTKETESSKGAAAEAAGAWDKEKMEKFKALNEKARAGKDSE